MQKLFALYFTDLESDSDLRCALNAFAEMSVCLRACISNAALDVECLEEDWQCVCVMDCNVWYAVYCMTASLFKAVFLLQLSTIKHYGLVVVQHVFTASMSLPDIYLPEHRS